MIKDDWVADVQVETEDGDVWLLKYYVRIFKAQPTCPPVYGLKIEKYEQETQPVEINATPGLTAVYEEALSLARKFSEGQVTPMSLLTLADEWAGTFFLPSVYPSAEQATGQRNPAISCGQA